MIVSCLRDVVSGVLRGAGAGFRHAVISSAMIVCGIAVVCAAMGFGLAAAYLMLAETFPRYEAAAMVAAGLMFTGAIILACAYSRRRPRRTVNVKPSTDAAARADSLAAQAIRDVTGNLTANPSVSVLAAVSAGLIVGLLLPRK